MTTEEIQILGKKIADGDATPEERLALLKELNATIVGLRQDVATLKNNKKLREVRQDIAASATK